MQIKTKLKSYNSPTFLAYALIAPAAIYILCIVAWPLIETIRLSFTNSSLAGEDYVGFENYQKMFSSKNCSSGLQSCPSSTRTKSEKIVRSSPVLSFK